MQRQASEEVVSQHRDFHQVRGRHSRDRISPLSRHLPCHRPDSFRPIGERLILDFLEWFMPTVWSVILALFLLLYVILEGFDLGVGILSLTSPANTRARS